MQGRLPQELRTQRIDTVDEANRYITAVYLPRHNGQFQVEPGQSGTAFVPVNGQDLDKIFSHQSERVVGNDNTITLGKRQLQIEQQTFRFSMAKCRVLVCEHLDGTISIHYGPHLLGRYDRDSSRPQEKAA